MALNIISLTDLLNSVQEESEVEKLLLSFCSIKVQHNPGADDVEHFLHKKAIAFEKMDLSRTYLVFSTYQQKAYLAGYFSISVKPLVIPKKHFKKLSKSLQRRLMGFGHKTVQESYEMKGFLLGQLGKNYSEEAKKANNLSGDDLLQLAYSKIQEAQKIVGGENCIP